MKAMKESSVLMSVLLAFLRDSDSIIARQSIVSGTNFFVTVLEQMTLQFHRRGKVEIWLEELWSWMSKFKDAVFAIAVEPGSVGTKLLALKFLETYILLFTSEGNDSGKPVIEASSRRDFNISWLVGGHPILDPYMLMSEANRTLDILLNLLRSSSSLPGSVTIAVVNGLAAIARKRPIHYNTILSALLDFDPNFEIVKGRHVASIQYSLRTAFLGFLRCTNPALVESRDRLLRALRAMNAGDAADQAIRQVEKMLRNAERASRDARLAKDDQQPSQLPVPGDVLKKRPTPLDVEESSNNHELPSKRIRYGPDSYSTLPFQMNSSGWDATSVNGVSSDLPMLDGESTHVEQMIAVIGALIAEGERGAQSLEILISNIHPDLLADIVITNMRHLPKMPPLLTRLGNLPVPQQIGSPTSSVQSPVPTVQMPFSAATVTSLSVSDMSNVNSLPTDSKRDPRRDPRRLDPRYVAVSSGLASAPTAEDNTTMHSDFDGSNSLNKLDPLPNVTTVETPLATPMIKTEIDERILDSQLVSGTGPLTPKGEVLDRPVEIDADPEVKLSSDLTDSPVQTVDEDLVAVKLSDIEVKDQVEDLDTSSFLESDQHSPVLSNTSASEDTYEDLPQVPIYVELTQEQERNVRKLAIERIIESYKYLHGTDYSQMRLALLARLVAQIDADDEIVVMLHKHIIVDYQQKKGHELVLHVLYHLHALTMSDSVENCTFATAVYEKFLLEVAKSLLESFPASDKSFSRLLGEVPILPDSTLKLLDDLCYSDVIDQHGKDVRDIERVTQGLGAVWSLILGRPHYRQSFLDITLKCAVHPQDEIRAKSIRLVANKLYKLSYLSEMIEKFATNMLMSAVEQSPSGIEHSQSESTGQRVEGMVGSQETLIGDFETLESGNTENDSTRKDQPVPAMSFPEVQRLISLFFALCTKKPSLIELVFNTYGHAPKAVKQAFHRHIPVLIRALGSSYSELLKIISDPPQGSENLLMLVLQILTQETSPSADLIATVKHLYETKLKDVTILIPMLSALSKNEVLPIFPRLVALPLEKFQTALAHILQGSAHTGPALTPAEVLVSIHGIVPEKDGLPLKKITDACSACFEQRTVFTQQVLAKALNQMVDQTPLPLLFMRTVIQAIDAFPSLVDFVMEILSKLVSKQVWRMPKLWFGFLKCASQTQPHSFPVLLQLPPQQLESALNKYANLRGPLATYASQPSVKASLPRPTLAVLGLANETHSQQPHLPSSFHPADTSSSVHGATPT
ncbi:symplekin [Pyrus x bretschneideri]|uniref:symplekin n=1 Tax=Pyrus x bretschneideri TaxID=225117 RepID=UPI0020301C15|nr:symplekin [Pyrus x bretschneideri]